MSCSGMRRKRDAKDCVSTIIQNCVPADFKSPVQSGTRPLKVKYCSEMNKGKDEESDLVVPWKNDQETGG